MLLNLFVDMPSVNHVHVNKHARGHEDQVGGDVARTEVQFVIDRKLVDHVFWPTGLIEIHSVEGKKVLCGTL